MSDYLFGLATLPAVAVAVAAIYGLALGIHGLVKRWWQRLHPVVLDHPGDRIVQASALMVARRVIVLRAPLGRVFVYRSRFTRADIPARYKAELDRHADVVRTALREEHLAQKEGTR
ncbi:hypothetical protein [Sanguibacter massiliensis]|uniref:hypothetical protein n=1 Tax=Sanguibacter massiliensis TaxID=1973217 RepID=UPI000C838871|nr:hypothetical protein [Sanguibacter massiliensis]